MSFFEKSLSTLELPAVLEMLAAEAVGESAREAALALAPSTDPFEVRRRLSETGAAKAMMVVRGSPSFSGVKDVRPALSRADLGGARRKRFALHVHLRKWLTGLLPCSSQTFVRLPQMWKLRYSLKDLTMKTLQ